jgi:hypothetical protein
MDEIAECGLDREGRASPGKADTTPARNGLVAHISNDGNESMEFWP